MTYFLNLNRELTELINFNRVAAPNYDQTSIEEIEQVSRLTSSIPNLAAIKTSVTNFASYVKDAKDVHNIVGNARSSLSSILGKLQTLREIAVFGQNTTLTEELRTEYGAMMINEVKSILTAANQHSFQDTKLLTGNFTGRDFQIGPAQSDTLTLSFSGSTPYDLGLGDLSIENYSSAALSTESIDNAIAQISSSMSALSEYSQSLQSVLDKNNMSLIRMSDDDIENLSVKISSPRGTEREFRSLSATDITTFLYSENSFAKSTLSIKL